MAGKIDLTGKVFGRLTVVREAGKNRHGSVLWLCRCECGQERTVNGMDLRKGDTVSCGCAKLERMRGNKYNLRHGACGHPLFVVWNDMMARCHNKRSPAYQNYGGRGVKVCERWRDPWKFFEDMGERPEGAELERTDNDGDYEPGNCRWATRGEQAKNRRSNRRITFDGRTKLLCEWAEETGINEGAIRDRLDNLGWSVEKALTTPISADHRRRGSAAKGGE